MKYDTFLFDADDTLFDFAASEREAFTKTLTEFGVSHNLETLYSTYRTASADLWRLVELGKTTKENLKTERFRRTFARHGVDVPAEQAGDRYLAILPETCRLMNHAEETCRFLAERATVAIITNGFEVVQTRRLAVSGLGRHIHFMVVSESCGHAKPDVRFFEHAASLVPNFSKERTLVVGDRLETDILGAQNFGVDACWFNPKELPCPPQFAPTFQIQCLSALKEISCP